MRFFFVVCLGVFSSCMLGQEAILSESTPAHATPTTVAGTGSSSDDSATTSAQKMSAWTNLADAPSATRQTTCIQKNGKPCPEWVHKLIGPYPPVDRSEPWDGRRDHFFTFGNARRTLHPDKKSWVLFTAAQAGMWAATVVAVRNHRTSGEEAHSEYPAAAFMTAMDLLIFKTMSPALSVGAPVFAMVHYSRAAAK